MVKRLRQDFDDNGNQIETWVRGASTLPKFRNKKSKWKSYSYTPYDTEEERLSNKPEQLSVSEWAALIRHWDTPEQQAIAAKARANRAKQIAKHTSGRISFPQLRELMTEEDGEEPSLGEFFKRSHISPKTHGPIDELSREYIDKMNDLAGIDENGAQRPVTNEIYRQVTPSERNGRVRLMGLGVTPTSYFGPRVSSSHVDSDDRIQELRLRMAEIQRISEDKEAERNLEIEEIKRQALEKEAEAQCKIDDMQRQFQSHYEDLETRLMQKMMDMNAQRGMRTIVSHFYSLCSCDSKRCKN
ncbi:hypothetical protein ACHQM5_010538 [Ranunculus cassubicifolius]